jgi:hypothetical protein
MSYSNAYVSILLSCEQKPHYACGHRALHRESTLVRVEITFVLIEITLRVEIALVSVIFTHIHVKLTLVCVESTRRVKSHSACENLLSVQNQSCAGLIHTRAC